MSTPTSNSIGFTTLNVSGLGTEGSVISGYKWGGGWGTGVNLTYSIPQGTASFITPYGTHGGNGEWDHWFQLTSADSVAVRAALGAWAAVANIHFFQVADNSSVVGDLRFARTSVVSGSENAHAYYPWSDPSAGDVWLNQASWHTASNNPIPHGTYDYLTLIHEIGHALGLKHPFGVANQNSQVIPSQFDSYSYTVMSYTATTAHHGSNYASFYPTTPMYYDLVAIQEMYGASVHNPGNTNYIYSQTGHYWQTIDNSGGIDTITVNGTTSTSINLNIGHWCNIGPADQLRQRLQRANFDGQHRPAERDRERNRRIRQ